MPRADRSTMVHAGTVVLVGRTLRQRAAAVPYDGARAADGGRALARRRDDGSGPGYAAMGDRLREARLARGFSVRGLAERLDVSPSLISQVETGRARPSVNTLYAIATELGVTSGAVLGALRRHGVPVVAHATSRGRAAEREAAVAARFGHPDIGSYLAERRRAGLSWRAIAAECGQPLSWVRRRVAR